MKTLVVGGTGPTGPHVISGVVARGHEVTMLHTGRHEVDEIPGSVEHLHTNPFDSSLVREALGNRSFDLAILMYGRLRDLVPVLQGRVGQLITVGGAPSYRGYAEPDLLWPPGLPAPLRESGALGSAVPDPMTNKKVARMVQSEQLVFDLFPTASHFRFPLLYGPRQVVPREWSLVRRILAGRRRLILPDGGLNLTTIAYVENAAHAILCAVDRPDVAAGQSYNVSDEWTPTLRQWAMMVGRSLDFEFEFIDMPFVFARPSWPLLTMTDPYHRLHPVDKAIYTLGYRDVVEVPEAIRRTARWLAENPLDDAGMVATGDVFDYDGEDRLIDAWLRAVPSVAAAAEPLTASSRVGIRYSANFEPGKQAWAFLPEPGANKALEGDEAR